MIKRGGGRERERVVVEIEIRGYIPHGVLLIAKALFTNPL